MQNAFILSSASAASAMSSPPSQNEDLILETLRALKADVRKHSDFVSEILLNSRDSIRRRKQIEGAFRACRNAFLVVYGVYLGLAAERTSRADVSVDDVKVAVRGVVTEIATGEGRHGVSLTYADAIKKPEDRPVRVRVPRGPVLEAPKTL